MLEGATEEGTAHTVGTGHLAKLAKVIINFLTGVRLAECWGRGGGTADCTTKAPVWMG